MGKYLIYILISATLLLSGCSKGKTPGGEGMGRISISGVIDASVETRAGDNTRALTPPEAKDFALAITGDAGTRSWATIAQYEAEEPLFEAGDYTVAISHGDANAEGADKPYFYGSATVTVLPRQQNPVQITASVANSQALVRATEQFLQYFHDATFVVATTSGNRFTFTPQAGVTADPVWVKAATKLTITGSARRQSQDGQGEGPSVAFEPQTLQATRAATCHIFTFSATEAGSATLEITLDDGSVEVIDVDVELNNDAI